MSAAVYIVPQLLTEREAATVLGVSVDTLRRERRRRRIGYIMIGGRPRYTPQHLRAYISLREVHPCDESSSDLLAQDTSATTGLADGQTAPPGAARGSIPTSDRLAEHRSALMILQPQGSRSRSGSQPTSAQIAQRPTKSPSPACSLVITNGTASTSSAPRRNE
jgi:excisionase family DNA binding protein